MTSLLWALTFLLPLATAAGLSATHRSGGRARHISAGAVRWAPLALLPAAGLAVVNPAEALTVDWLVLGTVLQVDVVSRALVAVAVLLYAAATWAVTWRQDPRAPELVAYLLVSFVGNIGAYLAGDLVSFYVFFGLMSFAAIGLVIHDRTAKAHRASRIYLALTIVSETTVLAAFLLIAHASGGLIADPAAVAQSPYRGAIIVLLGIGFGIKAGIVPLHVWLPLAHPAAPPPASAVLSGAMVKAGLVGWLRFLPLGEVALPEAGLVLAGLALAGALLSVPVGVVQRDPKVVLAYSTISQMGFLGAAVGIALASPGLAAPATTAAIIYAVHHGLAKGALFLGVSVWKHHGVGRRAWLVGAGLVVAGLAVVGAPFSTGAIGKYAVKEAIYGTTLLGVEVADLLPFVATGSTVLLLRFGWLLWTSRAEPLTPGEDPALPAWLLLVLTSATVPYLLSNRWVPLADVPGLEPVTVWDATWPILLGLGLGGAGAALAGVLRHRRGEQRPGLTQRLAQKVPPGDLVVPVEHLAARLGLALRHGVAALGAMGASARRVARAGDHTAGQVGGRLTRVERALSGWRASGIAVLTVLAVMIGLVIWAVLWQAGA